MNVVKAEKKGLQKKMLVRESSVIAAVTGQSVRKKTREMFAFVYIYNSLSKKSGIFSINAYIHKYFRNIYNYNE